MPQLSAQRYQRAQRIRWKNRHSRRLQQLVGDDRLVVGFDGAVKNDDGTTGCWVLARVCKRTVVQKYFSRELATEERVPVIFKHWIDDETGLPLSIEDPRLPDYLMMCDSHRRADAMMRDWNAAQWEEKIAEQSRRREWRDQAKALFPAFQKMADGHVGGYNMPRVTDRRFFYGGMSRGLERGVN
jgi:hypothetical protein